MKTCLVVVTYNRLRYTMDCIKHVLQDSESDFELVLWDNGSTDETPEYLMSIKDSRLKHVILSKENVGQTAAMNRVWSASEADFVGKLDNDCLVPPGWISVLARAHNQVPEFGAVACWHYRKEDFSEPKAAFKIKDVKGHRILKHPWVCGSGFLMKRSTYLKAGPWEEGSPDIGTTDYFLRMALKGWVNGWYVPLVIQHHMDDPYSPYCAYSDDVSLNQLKEITYTLRMRDISSMKERLARREKVIGQLLGGSPEARDYVGLRGKLRRRVPIFGAALDMTRRFSGNMGRRISPVEALQ